MNPSPKILLDKTITEVKTKGINCWELKFLDGSSVEIWSETEYLGGGISLPKIYLDRYMTRKDRTKRLAEIVQKSVDVARKKVNSMTPTQRKEEIKKIQKDFDKKRKRK